MNEAYFNITVQTFGALITIMIMIFILFVRGKPSKLDKKFLFFLGNAVLLLVANVVSWAVDKKNEEVFRVISLIVNFAALSLHISLPGVFANYLTQYLSEHGRKVKFLSVSVWTVAAAGLIALTVSQFNGMFYTISGDNVYARGELGWLFPCFGLTSLLILFFALLMYRKYFPVKEFIAFFSYCLLCAIGVGLQAFFYGSAYLYMAIVFSVVCMYVFVQAEQARRLKEKEAELLKSRTALALSKIQPHFLFNSLSVIRALCNKKSDRAGEALEHFSYYLRGNLDALNMENLIVFQKELEHAENYLYLEKIRFEERLTVEYRLETVDFMIPSFTLQPIVENAVKHGISGKKNGGTVTIATCRNETDVVLTVCDDGVGFDTSVRASDGKTHIGIENVRERLLSLCAGELKVESAAGKGTKVTVTLPIRTEADK